MKLSLAKNQSIILSAKGLGGSSWTSSAILCGLTPQSVIRRWRFSAGVPWISSFILTFSLSSICKILVRVPLAMQDCIRFQEGHCVYGKRFVRSNDSKTDPSISPSHPFPTFARLSSSELPPLSSWTASWGSRWYVEPARDGPGTLPWFIRLWGEAGVDGADCKCFWKGGAAFWNETWF